MLRKIDIHVTVDAGITFHFAEPLSITSVTVACPATEEIQWELINDAFKPVEFDAMSSLQMFDPLRRASPHRNDFGHLLSAPF